MIIGIWPILMGASMWVQQKLNPAPTDPIQAKIFAFFPLFLTIILASFPSGLVVYWTVNNILTIAQHHEPKFGLRWLRLDSDTSNAVVQKEKEIRRAAIAKTPDSDTSNAVVQKEEKGPEATTTNPPDSDTSNAVVKKEETGPEATTTKTPLNIKNIKHSKMTKFFVDNLVHANEIITIRRIQFWLGVLFQEKEMDNDKKRRKMTSSNETLENFKTNDCYRLSETKIEDAKIPVSTLEDLEQKEPNWRLGNIVFQALLSRADAGFEDLNDSVNESIESVMTGVCELTPQDVHLHPPDKLLEKIERMFQENILQNRDVYSNELRIPISELFSCFYEQGHATTLIEDIKNLKDDGDDPLRMDKVTYFLYIIANLVHGKKFEVDTETVYMLKRTPESANGDIQLQWVKANRDQMQYVLEKKSSMHIRKIPSDIMDKTETHLELSEEYKKAVGLQRGGDEQVSTNIPDMFPILVRHDQDHALEPRVTGAEFRNFTINGGYYVMAQNDEGVLNHCWEDLLSEKFELVPTETYEDENILNWDGRFAVEPKTKFPIESNTVIRLEKDAMHFLINRNLIDIDMQIDTIRLFNGKNFDENMEKVSSVLRDFFANAFDTTPDEFICHWPSNAENAVVQVSVKSGRKGVDLRFQIKTMILDSNQTKEKAIFVNAKTDRVLNREMQNNLRFYLPVAIENMASDDSSLYSVSGEDINQVVFQRMSNTASHDSDISWNTLISMRCRDRDAENNMAQSIEKDSSIFITKLCKEVDDPESNIYNFKVVSVQTGNSEMKKRTKFPRVDIVVRSSVKISKPKREKLGVGLQQVYNDDGVTKVTLDTSKEQDTDPDADEGERGIFIRVDFEKGDMAKEVLKMLTNHEDILMAKLNDLIQKEEVEEEDKIYPLLVSNDKDMESNKDLLRRELHDALQNKFNLRTNKFIIGEDINFNAIDQNDTSFHIEDFHLPAKDFFVGRIAAVREEENVFFVYCTDLERPLCVNLIVWKRNFDNDRGLKKLIDFDFFLYQPVVAAVDHSDEDGIRVSAGTVGTVAKITDSTLTINWGAPEVNVTHYSTTTKEFSLLIDFKPKTPGQYYEADAFLPEPERTPDYETALKTFVYDADADAEFNPFFYTTRWEPTIFESLSSTEIISKDIVPYDMQMLMTSAIHEYDIMKLISMQESLRGTRSTSALNKHDEDLDSPQDFLAFVSDIRKCTNESLYNQTRKVFDTYRKSFVITDSSPLNICDVIQEETLKQEWRRISNNFRNSKHDVLEILEDLGMDNQDSLKACVLFRQWNNAQTTAKKSVDAFYRYCNWIKNYEKKRNEDDEGTPQYCENVYMRKITVVSNVLYARKSFGTELLMLEQKIMRPDAEKAKDDEDAEIDGNHDFDFVWQKMLHEGLIVGQNNSTPCIFFEPGHEDECKLSEYFFFTLKRVACLHAKVNSAEDINMLLANSNELLRRVYAKIVNFLKGICPKNKNSISSLNKLCESGVEGESFDVTLKNIIKKMEQLSKAENLTSLQSVAEHFQGYFQFLLGLNPEGILDDTIYEGESFVIFDPFCMDSIVRMFTYFIENEVGDSAFPFALGIWKEIMNVLTRYFKDDNQFGPYSKFFDVTTQTNMVRVIELIMQWYTHTFFVRKVISDRQETAVHRMIYLPDHISNSNVTNVRKRTHIQMVGRIVRGMPSCINVHHDAIVTIVHG